MASRTRSETDALGTRRIPSDALFGIQSLRAKENFPISGAVVPAALIRAYAHVKKAAAQANATLGHLDPQKALHIIAACDEIIEGKHEEHFIVDIFQAGAGTSTNMNLNEVIANRALELMKHSKGSYGIISPNDHVNMGQSTNDTYPTAMRVAILMEFSGCDTSLEHLSRTLSQKGKEFRRVIKSARTHLQDAVPITLGQEFTAWSGTIAGVLRELRHAGEEVSFVGLGGSAAGTGINTDPKFALMAVKQLAKNTGLRLHTAPDLIESMQSQRQIMTFASALKQTAVEISRIASDMRLLASGPNTGLAEITLPAVQPGSSIMPGKVNPSILECVNMACYRVMGAETTVSLACLNGQLELNVNMPLMASELLSSMSILRNAVKIMSDACIKGITANKKRCEQYAHESAGLATALNPLLGYAKVAELVKESVTAGKPITTHLRTKNLFKFTKPNLNK